MLDGLCKLKYKHEITKSTVAFFKETIQIHLSTDPPFDSHSLVKAPMINSIYKPSLQEELYKDYKLITQQAKTNRLDIYMKTLENQIDHYEKHFNRIIDKIYKINSSIPPHQQLTSNMLHIIDQRLHNMTTYIQTLYRYKTEMVELKIKKSF